MQGQPIWKQEQAGTKQVKPGTKQGQAETARNIKQEKKRKNLVYGRSLNQGYAKKQTAICKDS